MRRLFRPVGRALKLSCPACGRAKVVRAWFQMPPNCPACGLELDRGPGYFLGAMAFNLVAAELLFAGALVALVVATWPAPPWTALWIGSVVGMVLAPIAGYPFSKTLWLAFDLAAQSEARHWDGQPSGDD